MNKEEGQKIHSFTDLNAWKESHKLAVHIYKITEAFPKREQYSIVDQMRRSAVSITSNIAEGFGRESIKDKIKFYIISQGSVRELQSQLIISRDVGYIENELFQKIAQKTITVHKIINGLIKVIKRRLLTLFILHSA
jgi:four helix bundle protein